jgi:hypothetical protein
MAMNMAAVISSRCWMKWRAGLCHQLFAPVMAHLRFFPDER